MSALAVHGWVGGEVSMGFDLDVGDGTRVALVGPNGAGKSTLLRTIAGHRRLESGTVHIGGRLVDAPDADVFVRPERRRAVYQPQSGALFTHLSALDNVAYGVRAAGAPASEARRQAADVLRRLGIDHLGDRRPAQLSGGQAARVALARSLAPDSDVVLLDEPSAAFDPPTRAWFRSVVSGVDRTVVFVTHDPVEAVLAADAIAVVHGGAVVQVGTVDAVTAAPANDWIADFLGLNVVRGIADGTRVRLPDGASLTVASRATGPVCVSFPANAVSLHATRPAGSARNVWPVEVVALAAEHQGDIIRIGFDGALAASALITPGAVRDLDLRPGSRCWASVKATEMVVIPDLGAV